ncbi:MAG: hypothetical protein WD851_13260 [Pirellulales bacterium]
MKFATRHICSCSLVIAASIVGDLRAASVATRSNPMPNGFFQMDGDLSDWENAAWYPDDAVGDGSVPGPRIAIDILGGAIAHNDNFIYVLYRNAADNMVDGFSNWVFFDLDQNQATGLNGAVNPDIAGLPIGIEFNLGGTAGWNAFNPAGAFVGGAAGKTVAVGDSDNSGGADFLEFAISRTPVSPNGLTFNPIGGTEFDVMFVAENPTGDYSPNNPADWFTYDAAGSYDYGMPGDADDDGDVDANDYLAIRANSFTDQLLGKNGDATDDGFVDFADFREWKASFPGGSGAAEAAIAALGVPEPGSLALCGIAAAVLLVAAGRKRNC